MDCPWPTLTVSQVYWAQPSSCPQTSQSSSRVSHWIEGASFLLQVPLLCSLSNQSKHHAKCLSVPAHLHPVCPALRVLPHLCADISPVPKTQGHSTPGDSPWYTPYTLSPLHSMLVNSQFIHSLDTYETPVDQKKPQPKNWGLCFIQWTCWGLKPGNSLSDSFEGLFLRGKGGARLYINRS